MQEASVKVYYLIDSLTEFETSREKLKKEVNGVSLSLTSNITDDLLGALKKIKEGGFKEILLLEEVNKEATSRLIDLLETVEPFAITIPNYELIPKLRNNVGSLRTKLGVIVRNPFPNFQTLKKIGVDFVVMPTALIKGRVVKEARASGLDLIAYLVNDPATYLKMKSSGVLNIITKNPGVIKEAEKIKF